MAAKNKQPETILLAREGDGTIQLTFTIPWSEINSKMTTVAADMAQNIEVPGFRKGKAPLKQVLDKIPREHLVEHTLQEILPKYFSQAIETHNIKPAMYPKFELISAENEKDWQIRAITAEIPDIKLTDYKKEITGAIAAKKIWTPQKGEKKDDKKTLSQEEKEQIALNTLLEKAEITIPHVLVEQEVDAKLAGLLERLETLGLSLESYLASTGKNPQELREEYSAQAKETLKLELILNFVAQNEKVEITDEEVNAFIKAAEADPNFGKNMDKSQQESIVRSVLRKRKVLSMLANLG